jgi:hypothetical protein
MWYTREVRPDITEEKLNGIASGLYAERVAATEFATPQNGRQLRCYRDISDNSDVKVWLHLRMGTPKKETMLRANMTTTQEDIERAASERW